MAAAGLAVVVTVGAESAEVAREEVAGGGGGGGGGVMEEALTVVEVMEPVARVSEG
jgi:hypothetical protein